MSLELQQRAEGRIVEVHASEHLTEEDYRRFTPFLERLIQLHGKVRVLFRMHDFAGWEVGAMWKDLKFDVQHFNDIERLAVVGEKKWHEWMAWFCKPFTTATIRYFDLTEIDSARAWLAEGLDVPIASRGERKREVYAR